jgi:hypothetical protein
VEGFRREGFVLTWSILPQRGEWINPGCPKGGKQGCRQGDTDKDCQRREECTDIVAADTEQQ